jgi:hypothetical protein
MPTRLGLRKAVATFALLHCAACEALAGDSGERLLLPRDFVRGYVNFEVAPPHNELDTGLCPVPEKPDASPPCSAFARYVWSGYVELQPFGRGALKRLFLFGEPRIYGGDNVPQRQYTYSAGLIIWERKYGLGIDLPRGFQLRLTQHNTALLGRYKPLTAPIWRLDGPYGLYTTVGMRWYFGSWSHDRRD